MGKIIDSDIVISIALKSIEEKIINDKDWLPDLNQNKFELLKNKQGAFTTLYNVDKQLRGCIGLPYPIHPLAHSIAISARKSATEDPRFRPVMKDEITSLIIEVEALGIFEKVEYQTFQDLEKEIELGKHGLMLKYKSFGGLLLPKVASKYNWDLKEYMEMICQKAMLPKHMYLEPGIELFKFTSVLYSVTDLTD